MCRSRTDVGVDEDQAPEVACIRMRKRSAVVPLQQSRPFIGAFTPHATKSFVCNLCGRPGSFTTT
jgi:hypothetical protein